MILPKTIKDYLEYKDSVVVYSGSRINESRADGTEDAEGAVGGGGLDRLYAACLSTLERFGTLFYWIKS